MLTSREIIIGMIETGNLLTIKAASIWATEFLGKIRDPLKHRLPHKLRQNNQDR
jgi:hypothetical protein